MKKFMLFISILGVSSAIWSQRSEQLRRIYNQRGLERVRRLTRRPRGSRRRPMRLYPYTGAKYLPRRPDLDRLREWTQDYVEPQGLIDTVQGP